jgi:phage shock protein C
VQRAGLGTQACVYAAVIGERYPGPTTATKGVPMATLVRPRQGRIIAGVCAGLARRFGISVTLIRIAFVIFAVTGIGELVYLILWLIIPKERY